MNVQRKNLKNEIKKEDAIANIETPKDNFTVKVVEALAKRKSGSESVEMTGDIQEMTSEKERSLIEFAGTLDFAPQMKAQEKETENIKIEMIGADETERVLVADSLETDLSKNLKDDDVSPIAEEAPRSLSEHYTWKYQKLPMAQCGTNNCQSSRPGVVKDCYVDTNAKSAERCEDTCTGDENKDEGHTMECMCETSTGIFYHVLSVTKHECVTKNEGGGLMIRDVQGYPINM